MNEGFPKNEEPELPTEHVETKPEQRETLTPAPSAETLPRVPIVERDAQRRKDNARMETLRQELGISNYKGNWSELLQERMHHPEIQNRFAATKGEHPPDTEEASTEETGIDIRKPRLSMKEAADTVANYHTNIDTVFSSTGYDTAASFGHQPGQLGTNRGYGDTGAVFRDAVTAEGKPLSAEQKGIVEAHEKAHGLLRNLTEGEKKEIRSVFSSPLEKYKGAHQADELLARMSQLKNYFGFKGDEAFTKEHLTHARAHYVEDTGLDNSMSSFLGAVPREKEDDFVALMNKYAL